jgi:hypothetical protein
MLYFGSSHSNAFPGVDADGDRMDNLSEYAFGTDPTNINSRLLIQVVPVTNQNFRVQVVFSPRLGGRTYEVLNATNLLESSWDVMNGLVVDEGVQRAVTDTNAVGPARFYRVRVSGY